MFQINFNMKCQKLRKMYSVGQENKKSGWWWESSFSFIRFHLAKVSRAISDKQTKDLTFKHGTFLIWLLSTEERPSQRFPASWKHQLLLIAWGASCEEHWWLTIKEKKFHSDVIIKGNDRDTKEMKKKKIFLIKPTNPWRPELTPDYKKNRLALKNFYFDRKTTLIEMNSKKRRPCW